LKDPKGVLTKPGENTQAGRIIRFTELQEVVKLEAVIKELILETIENEKMGIKAPEISSPELKIPNELKAKFKEMPTFKEAFEALTPGRQRAYLLFFNAAKQSKTIESRIEQYVDQIMDGKGIHDCTCGLSKKYPACDGSHKAIR
jgi:uncharacterized protein YdeI (YjbR/CyaY-like superfamily)